LLYVTLGIAACTDPARVIRSTNRDTLKVLTRSDLGSRCPDSNRGPAVYKKPGLALRVR